MAFWRLLRPRQWIKGLLVFAAPLFTGRLQDPHALVRELFAFVAIALVSSSVYVLNDICDKDRDRIHPVKKNRPIASGSISMASAEFLGLVCLGCGVAIATYLGRGSLLIIGVYVLLQLAYNFALKRVPVADVFLLSSGYVLRAALGAAAIHVAVSAWLLFCTGALALLVGIGKRRSEFELQEESGLVTRESLADYTGQGLDAMLIIAAAASAMSYGIYSINSLTARKHPGLIATTIWVFYAVFRYVYLVVVKGEGGEPETLFVRDPHILICFLLFVASAYLAMSGMLVLPILDSQ